MVFMTIFITMMIHQWRDICIAGIIAMATTGHCG